MTKPERRLRVLFKKWVPILGLTEWDIAVELDPQSLLNEDAKFEVAADCVAHWEYQRATIRFAEPLAVSDRELEETVVHELMHVVLSEMHDDDVTKHEERTAVVLTRAFLRTAA